MRTLVITDAGSSCFGSYLALFAKLLFGLPDTNIQLHI